MRDSIIEGLLTYGIPVAATILTATIMWASKKGMQLLGLKVDAAEEEALRAFVTKAVHSAEEWAEDEAKVKTRPSGQMKLAYVMDMAAKTKWGKRQMDKTAWDEEVKAVLAAKKGLGANPERGA